MDPQDLKYPFSIQVAPDSLSAYISAQEDLSRLTLEDFKGVLQVQRVTHGIIEDAAITQFLAESYQNRETWQVAEGRYPKIGRDAQVTYFFDKDPLKIGTLREGGTIDFKDKGEIPQVKAGDLLAEKVPLGSGESGMDVYGKIIPSQGGKDIPLRCGPGIRKSADGLKFYAQTDGRPELLPDGTLAVIPELTIRGDVNLETGHVAFNGFIDVRGIIQEGFRVRGGRLAAKEVYKADLEILGDIAIDGGIIGSKIFCKGNLKARYIHSSTIEAWGDVVVEGEVLNSQIDTNGALLTSSFSGKIFSSQIFARQGIQACQVGSDSSKSCRLVIGISAVQKKYVDQLAGEIRELESQQGKWMSLIQKLKNETEQNEKQIGLLAQIQDRSMVEVRASEKRIAELKGRAGEEILIQTEEKKRALEEKIRSLEKPLEEFLNRQDEIAVEARTLQQKIDEAANQVEERKNEIQNILAKPKEESKMPTIQVQDVIFSGTLVEGCYSSLQLQDSIRKVIIREHKITHLNPQGHPITEWSMKVAGKA